MEECCRICSSLGCMAIGRCRDDQICLALFSKTAWLVHVNHHVLWNVRLLYLKLLLKSIVLILMHLLHMVPKASETYRYPPVRVYHWLLTELSDPLKVLLTITSFALYAIQLWHICWIQIHFQPVCTSFRLLQLINLITFGLGSAPVVTLW